MRLPRLSSAFPMRFVSFVSLVSLVLLCQLVHQKGRCSGSTSYSRNGLLIMHLASHSVCQQIPRHVEGSLSSAYVRMIRGILFRIKQHFPILRIDWSF
jgi:hypothetical protein